MKTKYIAIKVKGFPHYIWFEREKTEFKNDLFIGTEGWCKSGALTNIRVEEDEIIGQIESDSLQYEV